MEIKELNILGENGQHHLGILLEFCKQNGLTNNAVEDAYKFLQEVMEKQDKRLCGECDKDITSQPEGEDVCTSCSEGGCGNPSNHNNGDNSACAECHVGNN